MRNYLHQERDRKMQAAIERQDEEAKLAQEWEEDLKKWGEEPLVASIKAARLLDIFRAISYQAFDPCI